ncbi:oligoribonuclease [Niallia circulans]|uniref:DHH family phosphoesterase n=1 Tax=Niallia circulans TaxID=1397 RepID=UPI000BA7C448|nr:oligoribonuclease [Niallia circulans]PAE11029.1 oligoribonuclease [Niallia circulans]
MYKLLSHNDLDGVGCGIIAKLAFGEDVEVRYNSVSFLNQEVEKFLDQKTEDTFLFITDLSVNEENTIRLDDYYKKGGKVQLIDHHKTALHLNDFEWGFVSVQDEDGTLTSATSLLYEYLVKHEYMTPSPAISEFVELVRQYDTWDWERNNNLEAQRLNALFYLISFDEFVEKMVTRLKESDHFYFDELETQILDMEEKKIDRYIRRKRRELVQKEIDGLYAGIVYAEQYHSELGNELGKEYPHLDYIAIVNIGGKKLGFRTIHDHVDVSKVAGVYGGGGHVKASGCNLTDKAYQNYCLESFALEPLREDPKKNEYNKKDSPLGTLFENKQDEVFFLYQVSKNQWAINHKKTKLPQTFSTFLQGEIFLRRNYGVWLARDDKYIRYVMDFVKHK